MLAPKLPRINRNQNNSNLQYSVDNSLLVSVAIHFADFVLVFTSEFGVLLVVDGRGSHGHRCCVLWRFKFQVDRRWTRLQTPGNGCLAWKLFVQRKYGEHKSTTACCRRFLCVLQAQSSNWVWQPRFLAAGWRHLTHHGQKFATGSWFDPDPRTRIHSLSRTSWTSTYSHRSLSSCSWAVKKTKLGVSLPGSRPWSDFFGIFYSTDPLQQPHFFVCLRRLCLRRSCTCVTQVLRLSLSLSHTHTHTLPLPSQIRAV